MINYFLSDFRFLLNETFIQLSRYDKIYELGETAVKRFGKDPDSFKKTLKKFGTETFKRSIKESAKQSATRDLKFSSWKIREYINCLIAILQVDFECPGFIQNFPEAIEYLKAVNGGNTNHIVYRFENLYDKTLETYNRYSGKSDFKYVKNLFEIPDKKENRRYDEKETRFDDYISCEFLKFWNSGDDEKKEYLREYYIYPETLLPNDYQELIRYIGFQGSDEIKLKAEDLKWLDIYFENIDKILEVAHRDIYSIPPVYMKKINLTLT